MVLALASTFPRHDTTTTTTTTTITTFRRTQLSIPNARRFIGLGTTSWWRTGPSGKPNTTGVDKHFMHYLPKQIIVLVLGSKQWIFCQEHPRAHIYVDDLMSERLPNVMQKIAYISRRFRDYLRCPVCLRRC